MASKKPAKPAKTLDNKVNSAATPAHSKKSDKTPAIAAAAKPVSAPIPPAPVPPAPVTPLVTAAASVTAQPARDRSTVVALIAKLRDTDADVARDAALTLGTLPADAEAVDALCAAVRNADKFFHPVVRAAAAASLGLSGDPRAVDALLAGTGDTMAEASEEAVKALGLLGDRRAVPTLEAIVRNDYGYFLDPVRRTAEAALARLSA